MCRHGTAWYTHRLGGYLLSRLSHHPAQTLAGALGETIAQLASEHRHTCDLADPSRPTGHGRHLAHKVALEAAINELRARRNQPGGYWIAKEGPAATD